MFNPPIRLGVIGSGAQARSMLADLLARFSRTEIVVICDPSAQNFGLMVRIFKAAGLAPPSHETDLKTMLKRWAGHVDCVYIATPHSFHFAQAVACLEAGLDVLLEKPACKTTEEIRELIRVCDLTGQMLSVAFQGNFSEHVQLGAEMIRSGELGPVQGIQGSVWQNWATLHDSEWRKNIDVSGGGFMFDTGSHLLNIVCNLTSDDISLVSATLDYQGGQAEIGGAVMGRLRSGRPVSLFGCGSTAESCGSEVRVFCSDAILRTTVWGDSIEIMPLQPPGWCLTGSSRDQGWEQVPVKETRGIWQQFLMARDHQIPNPSPPEGGLRMARLWEGIRDSACRGGVPIRLESS